MIILYVEVEQDVDVNIKDNGLRLKNNLTREGISSRLAKVRSKVARIISSEGMSLVRRRTVKYYVKGGGCVYARLQDCAALISQLRDQTNFDERVSDEFPAQILWIMLHNFSNSFLVLSECLYGEISKLCLQINHINKVKISLLKGKAHSGNLAHLEFSISLSPRCLNKKRKNLFIQS